MFCSHCGTRLAENARYCEECGAALPAQAVALASGHATVTATEQTRGPLARTGFPQGRDARQVINVNPTINVSVAPQQAAPPGQRVITGASSDVPLPVRVLWFLCVGVWFGLLWITVAWLLNLTIIGLPLGLAMLNRVPQVMTLQSSSPRTMVMIDGPTTMVALGSQTRQLPLPIRALYFLVIGIWLSLIWSLLAWVAAVSLIGLPLSFWMFNRVPLVTTLRMI